MAQRTLVQLRDQVKGERPEIVSNPNFPDLFLTRLINDGQKYVQIQLADLGIKKWEATDSITLGDLTYVGQSIKGVVLTNELPGKLFDGKDVIKYLECTGASYSGIARYVDDDIFLEHLTNSFFSPSEKQPIFTRRAEYIYVAPSTITAATAIYYKAVTDLSSDSDATTIPEAFEEFIIKKVLIEIDSINKKLQDKTIAINELTKDIKESFNAMGMAKMDEQPNTMTLQ